MSKRWRIAGINFDHFHMGDLLREVAEHPHAEIAGSADEQPERMQAAQAAFEIPGDRVFTDFQACLESCAPDLVILCPSTEGHAVWTEKVAPFGVPILMEKPFAASLADADRMITAMQKTGTRHEQCFQRRGGHSAAFGPSWHETYLRALRRYLAAVL